MGTDGQVDTNEGDNFRKGKMAGLPPWLQKGQDTKGKDSPGDMKKAAAKGAIQKRIAKNSKKKGAAPNPFGAK